MAKPKVAKETYLEWYESMYRQRKFEERAGMLYGQQKIRGFCHLFIGQEAVSAGVVSALDDDDPVITAYRDHGWGLARGMSPRECMAELFGKASGCSKGKGGSMHFFLKEKNVYGGHGIVGAQIPIGAGLAFADRYKKTNRVTACMFGDGAVWQGALHETFNLASLWKLPVVFICENNGYAMGTSVERSTTVKDIYKLGEAHDIPSEAVDGMDVESVYRAMAQATERARSGDGPTFLEVRTYRYKGHSMSDPQKYRTKDELNEYKERDPITQVFQKIMENEWATEEEIKATQKQIKEEIDDCVTFADESPWPDESEVHGDIYVQEDYPFLID